MLIVIDRINIPLSQTLSPGHFESLMPLGWQATKGVTLIVEGINPNYHEKLRLLQQSGERKEYVWSHKS